MRDQIVEPRDAFRHFRTMTGGNRPQDQRGFDRLKPFLAPGIEPLMQRLPHKAFERLHIFPDRQVRQYCRIVIDPHIHRVAALILETPDKSRNFVGEPVHALDIFDKFPHARIVERIFYPRDIELSEMVLAIRHAADSFGAQRAVFQSWAEAARQSNAWSLGPWALRCSSRTTASSTVGRCPAGTHHITKYGPSKCSNHSARRP